MRPSCCLDTVLAVAVPLSSWCGLCLIGAWHRGRAPRQTRAQALPARAESTVQGTCQGSRRCQLQSDTERGQASTQTPASLMRMHAPSLAIAALCAWIVGGHQDLLCKPKKMHTRYRSGRRVGSVTTAASCRAHAPRVWRRCVCAGKTRPWWGCLGTVSRMCCVCVCVRAFMRAKKEWLAYGTRLSRRPGRALPHTRFAPQAHAHA